MPQRPKPQLPCVGNSPSGASPPRRCAPSCSLVPLPRLSLAAAGAARSPKDWHWWPSSAACVDGPRLARDNLARSAEIACSHVSGLLMQSGWTAGPDGVREPRPHHSNGINVPTRRQAWLGCVGSTDCAITRHCSLASSSACRSGLSRRSHALVILFSVHHRPGDPRRLVRQRHCHD